MDADKSKSASSEEAVPFEGLVRSPQEPMSPEAVYRKGEASERAEQRASRPPTPLFGKPKIS